MNEKPIIIYGKGDFAELIYHYIKRDLNIKIVAFCVDKPFLDKNYYCEVPIVDVDIVEKLYPPLYYDAFVIVGYSSMRQRKKMFQVMKKKEYSFINYISPLSIIDSTVKIGENNIILDNVLIEPFTVIKDNNIFWSSSQVCHNTNISSHSFFAAKSLLGGNCIVKDNCFFGFSSIVIQNIEVSEETLLGANSLLLKDTKAKCKYIGNPAILKSTLDEGIILK